MNNQTQFTGSPLAPLLIMALLAACGSPSDADSSDAQQAEVDAGGNTTGGKDAPAGEDIAAIACACSNEKDTVCAHNRCQANGTCKVMPVVDGTPCDDGDPCSVGDRCAVGVCAKGLISACQCEADEDCADSEDGDLCNGSLFCNKSLWPYVCKVAPTSVVSCDPSTNACSDNQCDPASGKCSSVAHPDGSPCSDGDNCTQTDTCAGGKCQGTQTCTCKTSDDCAALDDGNPCNGVLFCDSGTSKCVVNPSTIVKCDATGDTLCKKNACQQATGLCTPTAVEGTTACDDNDKCTAGDHCSGGQCAPGANVCACKVDADCASHEDGDACNGVLFCHAASGSCQHNPSSVIHCPSVDDTSCAHNVCLPKEGTCTLTPREDVTEECAAKLDAFGGLVTVCVWRLKTAKDAAKPADKGPFACDDGDSCTGGEACAGAVCKASAVVCKCQSHADCAAKDDGDLCNGSFYCDKSLAVPDCVFNEASKVFCSKTDDTKCLQAKCDSKTGVCGLQPVDVGAACDDGKPCTSFTKCASDGSCGGGSANTCDDGNPCTVDSCDPQKGCRNASKHCSDGNDCTHDGCDPKTGACDLSKKADGAICNADNDGCTVNDTCEKGACLVGKTLECTNKTALCEQPACVSTGPQQFVCVAVAQKDGASCDVPGACLQGAECKSGACTKATKATLRVVDFGPEKGRTTFNELAVRSDQVVLVAGGQVTDVDAAKAPAKPASRAVIWAFDDLGEPLWNHEIKGDSTHGMARASAVEALGTEAVALASVGGKDGTLDPRIERLSASGKVLWSYVEQHKGLDVTSGALALTTNAAPLLTYTHIATFPGVTHHLVTLTPGGQKVAAFSWSTPQVDRGEVSSVRALASGRTAVQSHSDAQHASATWKGQYNFGLRVLDADLKPVYNDAVSALAPEVERGLLELPSGDLLIIGREKRYKPNAKTRFLARRVSATPQKVWRHLGAFGDVGVDLALAPAGQIAVIGESGAEIEIGSDDPNMQRDCWVGAMDDLGNVQWKTVLDRGHRDLAGGVDVLADGRIIAVGRAVAKDGKHARGWLAFASPTGQLDCSTVGKCAGKTWQSCSDGKACTTDSCTAVLGCVHHAAAGLRCSVSNGCSEEALCDKGSCKDSHNGRLFVRRKGVGNFLKAAYTHGLRTTETGFQTAGMNVFNITGIDVIDFDASFHHVGADYLKHCSTGPLLDARWSVSIGWVMGFATPSKQKTVATYCIYPDKAKSALASLAVSGCATCSVEPTAIATHGLGGFWALSQVNGSLRSAYVSVLANGKTPLKTEVLTGCGDGVCGPGETPKLCNRDCAGTDPVSCAGRCDTYKAGAKCQCDSGCTKYNDCCADKQTVCAGAMQTGTRATAIAVMPDLSAVVAENERLGNSSHAFVQRISLAVKTLWKTEVKTTGTAALSAIGTDPSGRVYAAGVRHLNDIVHSHLVARLDGSGKVLWSASPAIPDQGTVDAVRPLGNGQVAYSGVRTVDGEQRPALWLRDPSGKLLFSRTYTSQTEDVTKLLARPRELVALSDGFALAANTPISLYEEVTLIRTDSSGYSSCADAGTCSAAKPSCDDKKSCTADLCDASLGCVHVPITGNPCGSGQTCNAGVCGS